MQFVRDYMKAIDFIALAALVVIAAASLYRAGTVWLLIAAIVVAIWVQVGCLVSSDGSYCCYPTYFAGGVDILRARSAAF
jgi:hypothetical protein